ncbi:MAG: XRE family transcriptional regulator [Hyphomicrobiaceae bacterium]|nr:XRE family transcriptional regulator [Hyphomicrobiaceae bacterium]
MQSNKSGARGTADGKAKKRPGNVSLIGDLTTGSRAPHAVDRKPARVALGEQIRVFRQRRGLSSLELARDAGLSAGMLSKIENGQVSASLESLEAIADALSLPLAMLFQFHDEKKDCSFVQSGHGVTIERRGTKAGHQYVLLGHLLSGELVVEPYLITLTDEAKPYTNFRHAGVELIYMLSGAVVYRHADKQYHLRPGDALLFDATASHGPAALISTPMTYLAIIMYPRLR